MGQNMAATMAIYVILATCFIVSQSLAGEVTGDDVGSTGNGDQKMLNLFEFILGKDLYDSIRDNPRFLHYATLSDPEHSEIQNRLKRRPAMAGLENLDFMTQIFSKLPMSSNAAMSDIRQLMREAGRRRK